MPRSGPSPGSQHRHRERRERKRNWRRRERRERSVAQPISVDLPFGPATSIAARVRGRRAGERREKVRAMRRERGARSTWDGVRLLVACQGCLEKRADRRRSASAVARDMDEGDLLLEWFAAFGTLFPSAS